MNNTLMRSLGSPKSQRKTQSLRADAEAGNRSNGSNGSTLTQSESPISEIQGLDNLKVAEYHLRGSILFAEGQRPRGIYVLREGRAKVSITSAEGRTFVLRIAKAGDLLGVGSVLAGRPSQATVETMEPCRVDFVSRENLLRLLDRDKDACLGVAQMLSNKLSGVMGHARLLFLSESAAEKLARLLVKWCDDHGKPTPQGIRINSGFTHEEIAQMICSSRETVTRVLGEFRRRHIVSLAGNSIFVRNRAALEAVARC